MEYYSAIKKNEFMKFLGKWLDLEGIILSEVTQSPQRVLDTPNRPEKQDSDLKSYLMMLVEDF